MIIEHEFLSLVNHDSFFYIRSEVSQQYRPRDARSRFKSRLHTSRRFDGAVPRNERNRSTSRSCNRLDRASRYRHDRHIVEQQSAIAAGYTYIARVCVRAAIALCCCLYGHACASHSGKKQFFSEYQMHRHVFRLYAVSHVRAMTTCAGRVFFSRVRGRPPMLITLCDNNAVF